MELKTFDTLELWVIDEQLLSSYAWGASNRRLSFLEFCRYQTEDEDNFPFEKEVPFPMNNCKVILADRTIYHRCIEIDAKLDDDEFTLVDNVPKEYFYSWDMDGNKRINFFTFQANRLRNRQISKADLFMESMYAAIADEMIPMITGFGNGVDREGNAFIDWMLNQYPVLNEYMDGQRSIDNAFARYNDYKNKKTN